jgi:hypothetical protein
MKMQTKTKSIIVLIGVLIIGIVIGATGSSLLRKNILEERISRFKTPEGFTQRIIDRINPAPDKREAVEQILLEQHEKLRRKFEHTRLHMEAHIDSVLQQLQPLLNEEQFERAKRFLKKRPPHMRKDRRKLRPPRPPEE